MSTNSTRSENELQIFGPSGNVRARDSGTHKLFAVLTTFYWCEIIGAHQLALFRNLRARSERNVGNNQFFRRFVTMDETWIHHYTPESREGSKQLVIPGESASKRPKRNNRLGKLWLVFFGMHME